MASASLATTQSVPDPRQQAASRTPASPVSRCNSRWVPKFEKKERNTRVAAAAGSGVNSTHSSPRLMVAASGRRPAGSRGQRRSDTGSLRAPAIGARTIGGSGGGRPMIVSQSREGLTTRSTAGASCVEAPSGSVWSSAAEGVVEPGAASLL